MATSSSQISAARRIRGGDALVARPVAHRRHHLVERPFEVDRGRPRGEQRRIARVRALRRRRRPAAPGRSRRPRPRRSAARRAPAWSRIACAASSSVASRAVAKRCGSSGLVDDADRPAVRLEPDGAHGFAVDIHGASHSPRQSRISADAHLPALTGLAAISRRKPESGRWPPSTTKWNITIAPACRSIRRFSPAGRAMPSFIAPRRSRSGRAELGLSYGETPRQMIDMFLPDAGRKRRRWRCSSTAAIGARCEPSMFSHMARGLNAHGVAVAVAGLRSLPAGRPSPTSSSRCAAPACSCGSGSAGA